MYSTIRRDLVKNSLIGSASLYESITPLSHVKFPQKLTLRQTITCRNFIEEHFQEYHWKRLRDSGLSIRKGLSGLRLQQRPQLILQETWSWDGPSESQEWRGVQDFNLLVSYPPTVLWMLTETWDSWARVTHSEQHEHQYICVSFLYHQIPQGQCNGWRWMAVHTVGCFTEEKLSTSGSQIFYNVNTYACNCYWESSFSRFLVKLPFFPKRHPKSIFHYQFIMCTHILRQSLPLLERCVLKRKHYRKLFHNTELSWM